MCTAPWKGDTNLSRPFLPLIRGLKWADIQRPFPNLVWRGDCACGTAAGPWMVLRGSTLWHTRGIWRADVLSAAIQHQILGCTHITEDEKQESWAPPNLLELFCNNYLEGGRRAFWRQTLSVAGPDLLLGFSVNLSSLRNKVGNRKRIRLWFKGSVLDTLGVESADLESIKARTQTRGLAKKPFKFLVFHPGPT